MIGNHRIKVIGVRGEDFNMLRMAGFHLMFNSSRGDNPAALYGAMSRRVERRYDYSKMPTGAWMADNIGWVLGLAAALMVLIGSAWFAIRKPRPRATIEEAESSA